MRILIVAATEFEVGGLKLEVESRRSDENSKLKTHHLELLTTGVGMVATAFALGKHLANRQYDLAINLGIAGSFDCNIALGEVVEVIEDTFSELGVEDDEQFISIDNLGFGKGTFKSSYDIGSGLKQVNAITVNQVHGNEQSILKLQERIQPQLESMEGAAFFYACEQVNLPCVQIRAVSNYVEKRNRDAWEIGLAIKNLNSFAIELINKLQA